MHAQPPYGVALLPPQPQYVQTQPQPDQQQLVQLMQLAQQQQQQQQMQMQQMPQQQMQMQQMPQLSHMPQLSQLQQQQQCVQQPQPQYLPIGGDARMLSQLMATPLWTSQAAPTATRIMPAPLQTQETKKMDADAIAARVLEKVRERVGEKAEWHQVSSPRDGRLSPEIVELKAKSASLSKAKEVSPSVRSLATSIVDSVSDVL